MQTSHCVHIHYVHSSHSVHIVYVHSSHSVHIHYVQTRPTLLECASRVSLVILHLSLQSIISTQDTIRRNFGEYFQMSSALHIVTDYNINSISSIRSVSSIPIIRSIRSIHSNSISISIIFISISKSASSIELIQVALIRSFIFNRLGIYI